MAAPVPDFATGAGKPIAAAAAPATEASTPCTRLTHTMEDQLRFVEPAKSPLNLAGWHPAAARQPPVPPPATPPLLPAQVPAPGAARCAASCQSPCVAVLPRELLAAILELVLADDAANDRRPLVQFVSTAWLAAYRCVAHRHVSVHVATALRKLQKRCKLSEQQAEAALLRGLAARLPLAAEVTLVGVPPPPHMVGGGSGSGGSGRRGDFSAALQQQLHWRLGELLAAALGGSGSLRQLTLDWLPHLPLLLAARAGAQLGLDRLSVTGMSSCDLLAHLPALRQQPLQLLGISDAACLPDHDSLLLAAALEGLNHLTCLSLGGNAPSSGGGSGGGDGEGGAAGLLPPLIPAAAFGRHDHNGGAAAAAVAAGWPPAQQPQAAAAAQPPAAAPHLLRASLPSLQLVAAAAALPGLQQLELSLTFGKQPSQAQQDYLVQLGLVLHQQRRLREDASAAAAACRCLAAPACSCACALRAQGSRVSVVVHEGVQGDLSAVPVASCSLNLDWDNDSNPIEVWQCSTLRRLRIAAQLPLQAGQFRPARLAALQELEVAGCCHMPAYFAEALTSMQQLSRLAFSDCQPEALAAIPWQHVLPRLPQLAEMALERCAGVVMLPTLWLGLACCTQLHSLSITGNVYGGFVPWSAAPPSFATFAGPDPPGMVAWQQHGGMPAGLPQQLTAAAAAYAPSPIPDCVALMRQLRRLDLSHNGLHALPDSLGWCQQLSSVRLSGNQLQSVPLCVQALAGLRKLDLSSNQLICVEEGPYLHNLEHLLLGGNMLLLPSQLPASLESRARLRRLSLPLWWQQLGVGHAADALLAAMPWLQLEAS